jgi:hypothetical protein
MSTPNRSAGLRLFSLDRHPFSILMVKSGEPPATADTFEAHPVPGAWRLVIPLGTNAFPTTSSSSIKLFMACSRLSGSSMALRRLIGGLTVTSNVRRCLCTASRSNFDRSNLIVWRSQRVILLRKKSRAPGCMLSLIFETASCASADTVMR